MKIAVLHSFYSNMQPSGENNVVLDQVEALKSAGHEVLLISKSTDDQERNKLNPLTAAVRVATGRDSFPTASLKKFKPDIVHIHNLFPNIGTSWLKSWDGPVVVTVHNYRAVCSNGMLYRDSEICTRCPTGSNIQAVRHSCYRGSALATIPLAVSRSQYQNDVLNRADAVVMVSEGAENLLQQFVKVGLRSIQIPNFGAGQSSAPLDAELRIPNGWLALGRKSAEKGFLELVGSWPVGHKLTVIGDGPQDALIKQVAKGKDISVLPGLIRDRVHEMLPHFTGLVLPSRWFEVAPQVVVEAMRVGLPVVANSANVTAALVRNNGVGESYSNGDELTQALTHVQEQLLVYSTAARKYFDENWLQEKWLMRIEELYSRLILERQS